MRNVKHVEETTLTMHEERYEIDVGSLMPAEFVNRNRLQYLGTILVDFELFV